MHRMIQTAIALTLGLVIQTSALASPKQLITHNLTDRESNAFIEGTVPSPYPTKAHSVGKVFWASVRMSCFGHTVAEKCPALIRIGTNTDNPLDIGVVELNIETGEITPSVIHGNGYKLIVNGIAESTITVDD